MLRVSMLHTNIVLLIWRLNVLPRCLMLNHTITTLNYSCIILQTYV